MSQHIILKIDVTKINKQWLFAGQKGTYLDAVVFENDQEDIYGNSHVVRQNPPKEEREQGVKGIIIGNGKWMYAPAKRPAGQPAQRQAPATRPSQPARPARGGYARPQTEPDVENDEIPF